MPTATMREKVGEIRFMDADADADAAKDPRENGGNALHASGSLACSKRERERERWFEKKMGETRFMLG